MLLFVFINLAIRFKFLRPMSGHLVWQLLKAWSWRTVKLNTTLQCILSSLGKRWGPSFEQNWIPCIQGCFMPILVEIGPVVLEKKIKRRTTDKFGSEKLTRAFGSGELKINIFLLLGYRRFVITMWRLWLFTFWSLTIPVNPPKFPGSTIDTLTPNFLISNLRQSEKFSAPNLVLPYTDIVGRDNIPFTLVTFTTLPMQIVKRKLKRSWLIK